MSASEAQDLVDQVSFLNADYHSLDRAYGILNGSLLAYSEAIYFSANCTVRDIHGPYAVTYQRAPCQLLVRDYYQLRNDRLEPETMTIDLDAVRTYSLYNQHVHFSFSVLNDYISDAPLSTCVIAHAAELSSGDATIVAGGLPDIQRVNEQLSRVIADVTQRTRNASSADQTLEIIRRTYYRASPISNAVGADWEPSHNFLATIRSGLNDFRGSMPPQMTREAFGELVDPRT
jgi:hypothetical protein